MKRNNKQTHATFYWSTVAKCVRQMVDLALFNNQGAFQKQLLIVYFKKMQTIE